MITLIMDKQKYDSLAFKKTFMILLCVFLLLMLYFFFIYIFPLGSHEYVNIEYRGAFNKLGQPLALTDREDGIGYTLSMFFIIPFKSSYYTIADLINGYGYWGSFFRAIIFPLLFWFPAGFFLYFLKGTFKKKILLFLLGLTVMLLIRTFLLIECFYIDEVMLSTLSCLMGYAITKAIFGKTHRVSRQ